MTDLVARVLLKADASGLVGQTREGASAMGQLGTAVTAAAGDAKALAASTSTASSEVRELGSTTRSAAAAVDALSQGQRQVAAVIRSTGSASRQAANDLERHAFGARNLGQQFGDLGLSIAGGISPARAFGQQAGQIGYALSEMGGKAGAVGAFLTGPWGIALTIGLAVLAPFVEKLFEGGEAADAQRQRLEQAAQSADSYGSAQNLLSKVVDLTTGKLKTQNVVLIQQIKLLAQANLLAAQKEQKTATSALADVATPTIMERFGAASASIGSTTAGAPNIAGGTAANNALAAKLAPVRDTIQDYIALTKIPGASQDALDRGLVATQRRIDALARSGRLAGRDLIDAQQAVLSLGKTLNDQKSAQQVLDALAGKGIAAELRPYERPKKGTKKSAASTAALGEFGRDAGDRIAGIVSAFDDAPAALDQTNAKVRQLDDLIDDLRRKRPPNFEGLIASAEKAKTVVRAGLINGVADAFDKPKTLADQAAKAFGQLDAIAADLQQRRPPDYQQLLDQVGQARGAIQDGLNRPIQEFVEQQNDLFRVNELILGGQQNQAAALRIIIQLERLRGPLNEQQRAAIIGSTQALAAQERQIARNRERQQVYLDALGQMKGIVQDATQAFVRGDLGQIIKSPKRLLDAFLTLKGNALFQDLFADVFHDLEDQANGAAGVKDASETMRLAIEGVASEGRQLASVFGTLATAGQGAAVALAGRAGSTVPAGAPTNAASPAGVAGAVASLAAGATASAPDNGDGKDIVVVGRRTPEQVFGGAIGKLGTTLAQTIGIDKVKAGEIGKWIGEKSSTAFAGAATGTLVSGIGNAIGVKLSSTGAQIGGAIGNFLPIPGGSIIGSIAGGLIGNLFKKSPKGAVTITGADSSSYSGSGKLADGLNGDAATVQQQLKQVASALGATLGAFGVSIGKNGDWYHVSGDVGADVAAKHPRSPLIYEGKDQGEAIAAAVANAIQDGAVKGLSKAVQQALASSSDVEAALQEALKVREVEQLLGGVAGQIKQLFTDFDTTAAERVRIAKAYGLDLVEVERINAEQRADLVESTLKARTGALQDVLKSLKYGDLFEGDAATQLAAIRSEIDKVKVDAEAGKEGSADALAELYRNLVSTSREAYGTAGPEYAADRGAAVAGIERVVKIENDRIAEATRAQTATTDAVKAGNTLLDQIADLTVTTNEKLTTIAEALASSRIDPTTAIRDKYVAEQLARNAANMARHGY